MLSKTFSEDRRARAMVGILFAVVCMGITGCGGGDTAPAPPETPAAQAPVNPPPIAERAPKSRKKVDTESRRGRQKALAERTTKS